MIHQDTVTVEVPATTLPPFFPADVAPAVHARAGHEGHEVHSLPTDDAGAERMWVLTQGGQGGIPPKAGQDTPPGY